MANCLIRLLASLEDYLFLDVFHGFDEDELPFLLQMPVDRSKLASKDSINRNSQRHSLSVHRAAATDYQVGEPNQIDTVDSMFGNHDLVAADPLPPGLAQGSGLVLIARKQYDADFWYLCEEIQRG